MKKNIVSIVIMLLSITLLVTSSNAATFTINSSMKSSSSTIKVGETATLTISANEKIVAANFEISYDKTIFELEGSATSNLSVAEKNGKIACIYADISGTGVSEFKIKFKALKETSSTSLKIEDAKFRAEGQDDSYSGDDISGLSKGITVKVEKLTSEEDGESSTTDKEETSNQVVGKDNTVTTKTNLPKTGKASGLIIAVIAILAVIAIVFGKKSKELSKIFSSISVFVIALVAVTMLNSGVYAADANPKEFGSASLSNGESYMGILLDKSDDDRKIIKSELMGAYSDITDILDKDGNSLKDTDLVKTGFDLKKTDKVHKVLLYGDANGDGIICDTDDIMVIINDFLGKKEATDLNKLAANLDARDDKLDADDLIQMINMYLGKLDKDLVVVEKENVDIVGKWIYSYATKDGEEVSLNDVFGTSAIGSVGYLDFGMDGTFINIFPGATSSEVESNGTYSLDGETIKLEYISENVNVKFYLLYDSANNTINYPFGEYILVLKTEDQVNLENNWEYEISDTGIVLNKYIGEDTDVTVKSNYKIGDKNYTAKLAKTEVSGYEPDGSGSLQCSGPFIRNTIIEKVTFEKVYDNEDIFGTDVSHLFYECTNLKRVIGFEGNMTNMKASFEGCTSLLNEMQKTSQNYVEGAEIVVPDSVTNLDYAFAGCKSMKYLPSIGINSKLETAYQAFAGCSGADSGTIYLPETLTDMSYMFYKCSYLGNYTGTGFVVYSYVNTDSLTAYSSFNYCGVEPYGGSAYGTKEYVIIIKNADSEQKNKALEFFQAKIEEADSCYLSVKSE